ncbi:MAG: hypothetical protein AAGI48_06045 [Verrucomicrobiota bacterium]
MRILAAILSCLLLGGCFDVREEIWIERDGSGRAAFDYRLPRRALELAGGEAGLKAEVGKLIDSEPELHLDALRITEDGKEARIELELSTDSMLSLLDMPENEHYEELPDATKGFAGNFDIRLRGLSLDFKRRIDLKEALGLASIAIGPEQRRERRLKYIIHLPAIPDEHNAMQVENEGRTLIWDYTLGEALRDPVNTTFQVRIPLPWWIWLIVASTITLIVFASIFVWKRRRAALKERSFSTTDAEVLQTSR